MSDQSSESQDQPDTSNVTVPNITNNARTGLDAEPLKASDPATPEETPFPDGDSIGGHDMIRTGPDGQAVEGDRTNPDDDEWSGDPRDHTVDEVLAHLEGKDADYINKVLDQERAGKGRSGIVGSPQAQSVDSSNQK